MEQITIVGLGPGPFGLLTMESWEAIKNAESLILRTAVHPTADELIKRGLCFASYDDAYERGATFDEVYETIVRDVIKKAKNGEKLVYAVPGSPLVAEKTVALIRERGKEENVPVKILAGMSFIELLYNRLGVDPSAGITIMDGADLESLPEALETALVVTQVYNRRVASEVKLSLMELYPDDFQLTLAKNLGLPGEIVRALPLYELDRQDDFDHLTSVYVPAFSPRGARFSLRPATEVMARLRSPGGCVWDIEQTHRSLRRNLIEEVYEVIEAIDLENPALLCEELGDLLLQVVFHARMAEEAGDFSMQDVVDGISKKLVRRHPHVFGDVSVKDAGEVVLNWDAIKKKEKAGERKYALDGVPKDLPALSRAAKLQAKASKVGFDWDNAAPVWEKIKEEIAEFKEAVESKDQKAMEEEFGDILFSFVNLSRMLGIDPEVALSGTNRKFYRRFSYVESAVLKSGFRWEDMSLESLDRLWNESKVSGV